MKKNLGFSLIELLVVIAIIGLLTAIAAPAYRLYTIKSKLGGTIQSVEHLVNQAILYAEKNGQFPKPEDLGYAGTGENFDDPKSINSAFILIWMSDSSTPTGCARGGRGQVGFRYDNDVIGLPPGHYYSLSCFLFHTGSTWSKLCATYTDEPTYKDVFPGVLNYTSGDYVYNQEFISEYNTLLSKVTCP